MVTDLILAPPPHGHIVVVTDKGTVHITLSVTTIKELLQRSVNTYSEISPELYKFSDRLNEL